MAAGAQTTSNSTAVWTDLTKLSPMVWVDGARVAVEEIQPVMDLYDVDQLDQFNRDYGTIADSGFGHVIDEGADYITRTNNQGDTLSLTCLKRGDAASITEDLIDGNKYREIQSRLYNLGGSLFRQRCRDATHVAFTFGTSTSYTDADGNTITNAVAKGSEAVFADTHTMADASTFDNLLADAAIGETTLRNLEDLTTDFKDENGHTVTWGLGGKVLLHSTDAGMGIAGLRLTTQEWNYNSASRDINPFSNAQMHGGAYTRVVLQFLASDAEGKRNSSKDKYYFILDRRYAKNLLVFGSYMQPFPMGPFRDIYNGGQLWQSKSYYDLGCVAAHFGAGCPATT